MARSKTRAPKQQDPLPALKLSIELIPTPCWGRNLRMTVPKGQWTKISQRVRAEAGRCQICGGTNLLQCDERWEYDDKQRIQHLAGLRCVCQTCHNLMNIGRTAIIADEMADRYPTLMEDVIAHFMRVNGVTREVYDRHWHEAVRQHSARSAFADWTVDYGEYAGLVHDVAQMRARRYLTRPK